MSNLDDAQAVGTEQLDAASTTAALLANVSKRFSIVADPLSLPMMRWCGDARRLRGRSEIAQMIDFVLRSDDLVPAGDQRGIMLGNGREGALIDPNPARVAKMRVAGEIDGHGLLRSGLTAARWAFMSPSSNAPHSIENFSRNAGMEISSLASSIPDFPRGKI